MTNPGCGCCCRVQNVGGMESRPEPALKLVLRGRKGSRNKPNNRCRFLQWGRYGPDKPNNRCHEGGHSLPYLPRRSHSPPHILLDTCHPLFRTCHFHFHFSISFCRVGLGGGIESRETRSRLRSSVACVFSIGFVSSSVFGAIGWWTSRPLGGGRRPPELKRRVLSELGRGRVLGDCDGGGASMLSSWFSSLLLSPRRPWELVEG
jgi:hypothetical protein